VLAVNKMDLVGYDQAVFDAIVEDYRAFASEIGITSFHRNPDLGLQGRQYHGAVGEHALVRGPALIEHLETVDVGGDRRAKPFRMPVQWVNRPNLDFRGFSG
jgi:bifunctional enzyme CysN/CysC